MRDLVQWLRAQLDDDERAARRAGDSFRQIGETGVIVAVEGDRAEECASANWAGIAEHIVAHDPARVLREIEAKRRIMECHEPWVAGNGDTICGRCGREHIDGRPGGHFPCQTLRLLALPYAHRPGYRDEWRP
ncbi:DUF6221 family protein [Streptomyces antibioticus]|uniref:DUF6221 family protein n=1 Tax=Streptomyces antibioticus TaxID=1890 RepID=UPI0036FFF2AC